MRLLAALLAMAAAAGLHFTHRELAFTLENGETPRRYAPETMAGGVATFDFDNDGKLDLYFANGAEMPSLKKTSARYWNRLYRGDGKGGFADVTEKAGVAGSGYDTGIAIADYDNDGFPDIFVGGVYRNTLYHNNGDGTFTDVTAKAGLAPAAGTRLWSVGAAWVDVNNDGLLDLFVVNYLAWDAAHEPLCEYDGKPDYCHPKFYKGTANTLYINRGNGVFENASERFGLTRQIGKGMGVAIADYDGDGFPDLFVTNDTLYNFLFHNVGGKRFEEVAFETGVALAEHGEFISGMGVDFRDVDNDGRPDIFFVALDNQTFPLYRNTGKGFQEITFSSGLTKSSRPMAGYSPGMFDFDNDGWKDLFVSRGHVQSLNLKGRMAVEQPNAVFRNLANGKFAAALSPGFDSVPARRHRGSAWGDFNRDGKTDVVVTALAAKAELWLNDGAAGNWLDIKPQGTKSNRDGIGAVIKVVTKGGAQYNHVTTAVGYASSSATPVHFGLGSHTVADVVEIRWPAGGVQRLTNVRAGQILSVKEP